MRRLMKKKYTRKQICEAISYWRKQLRAGNYRKMNESIASMPDAKFMIRYRGSEDRGFAVFFKDMNLGKQIFKYTVGSFAYRKDDDNLDYPFSENFNADPSDFIIPFGQAYNTFTSSTSQSDESYPLASAFRDIDAGYFNIGFQDNGFDADYLGTVDFSDEDISTVDQNAGQFRVSDLIWSNNAALKTKVEAGLRNGTIVAMYLKD